MIVFNASRLLVCQAPDDAAHVLPSSDPTAHLLPNKTKDFTAFINLVDFCRYQTQTRTVGSRWDVTHGAASALRLCPVPQRAAAQQTRGLFPFVAVPLQPRARPPLYPQSTRQRLLQAAVGGHESVQEDQILQGNASGVRGSFSGGGQS